MTNFAAFCEGFWSAWDFTRPFSERCEFRPQEEMRVDHEQLQKRLRLNENVWDSIGGYFGAVGGYMNNAIAAIDEEIKQNDGNKQNT